MPNELARQSTGRYSLTTQHKLKNAMYKILALLLASACHMLQAEPAYITDHFTVTVRSGESAQHRVITFLETGAQVEVLSVNPKKGYTRVRLENGKEGYILTRQLKKETIAKQKLEALQQEIDAQKNTPDAMKIELASLNKQHTELQSVHQQLSRKKREIETELAAVKRTSADAIRISNERNQLRKQVTDLTRDNEELKQEKLELDNSQQQRWFLIGAGVVVLGIFIGLVLPRLYVGKQKDASWGSSLQ